MEEAIKSSSPPARDAGQNLLTGKIVLLGGSYSVGDYHPGPNGSMIPGVELVASAVEAQIAAPESHPWLETFFGIVADLLLAVLIAWIYFLEWRPVFRLLSSLLLAGVVLFVPGVLLYWFGIWSENPFLLVFGMMIDHMYEPAGAHNGKAGMKARYVRTVIEE